MAGCGYVCPSCEGTGLDKESLESCKWCNTTENQPGPKHKADEINEWVKLVHDKNCCSDIGSEPSNSN